MVLIETLDSDKATFWTGFKSLWERQAHCDVTLKSRDGTALHAHRVILAASNEALSALMNECFVEGNSGHVQIDASHSALTGLLSYIYGKHVELSAEDAIEVLHLAHMYGFHSLQNTLVDGLRESLRETVAVQALAHCRFIGLIDFENECELCVAQGFAACMQTPAFDQLSESQLARLLKHPALVLPREELALEAVLSWYKAIPGRELAMGVLFQLIGFERMAETSLRAIDAFAETVGTYGIALQREARLALKVHAHGGEHAEKRTCVRPWWPGLGASTFGGVCVAGGAGDGDELHQLNSPAHVRLHKGNLLIADWKNNRILIWLLGALQGQAVAGRGAPINGINELPERFSFDVLPGGELIVADAEHRRILQFHDGFAKVILEDQFEGSLGTVCTRGRAVYFVDKSGKRVRKLEDGITRTVLESSGAAGSTAHFQVQGPSGGMHVSESGAIYIIDTSTSDRYRVRCWAPGAQEAATVLEADHVLSGVQVAPDGTVYVAYPLQHKVTRWRKGASTDITVAGGNGAGDGPHQLFAPCGVAVDDTGALFVAEAVNARVTKWGPAETLSLSK